MAFFPAHEAHAIDKVSATITLDGAPIKSDDWLKVILATAELGKDRGFSSFSEGIGAAFSVGQPTPGALPLEARTQLFSIGVGFKRSGSDGKPLVEFMVQRNEIKVDLHAYVRWQGFRELVLDITSSILPVFPSSVSVSPIKLEYWDRFVSASGQSAWSELFRTDKGLAAWTSSGSDLWHTHMGWFDIKDSRRRLVNLHIDTLDQAGEGGTLQKTAHVYTMTSTVGESFSPSEAATVLATRLDELHEVSKSAVGDVLSPTMQERISLFGKPETGR